MRHRKQAGIGGRRASKTRDGHAERLGHHGHRRRGAHGVAMSLGADHRLLRREELLVGDGSRAGFFTESPDVGAASECFASEVTREHGAPGYNNRGQVHGCGSHEQRRNRFVAPPEQNEPINRVGAEHLFHRHRGHVAPEHRRGFDLSLAERNHR